MFFTRFSLLNGAKRGVSALFCLFFSQFQGKLFAGNFYLLYYLHSFYPPFFAVLLTTNKVFVHCAQF